MEKLRKTGSDKVTGFSGIVTGVACYAYSETQLLIESKTETNDYKSLWISESRFVEKKGEN